MTVEQISFLPPAPEVPGGESDEWYTPARVFDPLHAEFDFTLDVAATAESAKAPRFFTREQDGLKQSWAKERVWCNPPYSDIEPWVRRANLATSVVFKPEEAAQFVVMLLPCWMDRAWWHAWVEPARVSGRVELRFIKGRVRFGYPGNPEAKGRSGGGFDASVILVWRPS